MKHSVPDEEYTGDDYEEYNEDYAYVEDDADYAQSRTSGAVVFLGAAAAVCLVLFLLILAASFLLRLLENWMDGSDSYELVQDDHLIMSAGTYSHPDRGTPFDERSREFHKNGKGGR